MNEKLIQKALFRLFNSHKYLFTNVYFFNNESDFLSFLPSGFCYECEIKISRSDFKADFKKEKHAVYDCNQNGSKTFIRKQGVQLIRQIDWEFMREFPELIESSERIQNKWIDRNKFEEVAIVEYHAIVSSKIEFVSHANKMLPNKFFYVVPKDLISVNEIPDYAGLIYVNELGNCIKVKDEKFIHKDKLDVKKLFAKMYYSYERELISKLRS